jgi:pimeloyl-ACP methyl ester carboxylesterase
MGAMWTVTPTHAGPGRGMHSFAHDGLDFDVLDSGPADGEPVVLLHGFPQDASAWHDVAPRLNAAGLRTLAPDQRGYSPGARPPARAAYRIRELVRDVHALLDAARLDSAHLVGHDWGGTLAWMLAARSPDRVRSLTVLSTPHPDAMTWAMTHSRQAWMSRYMLAFQLPWVPERVLAARFESIFTRTGLPASDATRYAARIRSPGDLSGPLGWYRATPPLPRVRRPAPRGTGARSPAVPRTMIDVPTTYIWGRHDFALGRAAALRTAASVRAPYRFVELDASHWLPETEPVRVAGEIIDRVSGRATP